MYLTLYAYYWSTNFFDCEKRKKGNYVKMVHNGIEYGDMQLIGEVYDILKVR